MIFKYYIIYKPFGMLSQFSDDSGTHPTLADLDTFPKDVYPVGRLDKDSEGLLILTNDKSLNHRLLHPTFKHKRTYWVQVEGIPSPEALQQLRDGVNIKLKKKIHQTLAAQAQLLETPPQLPPRNPPIRFRKSVADSWIQLTLREGKNRQVRRMTAKVGYPTLRLVRIQIEQLRLGQMQIGEVKELKRAFVYKSLFK